MFLKLLEYNWKVFKSSLTGMKVFVFLLYGGILLFIFFNTLGIIASLIFVQDNTLLYQKYEWLTPQIATFALLLFTNLLWVTQLIFTNVRQLQLEENRKLLTVGYPVNQLARQLLLLGFFHPQNILFNSIWILFLYIQYSGLSNLPLIFAIVLLNYGLIYSIKFRFLEIVKEYHKWILLFTVITLFVLSSQIKPYLNPEELTKIEPLIPAFNEVAGWFPGGLIQFTLSFPHTFTSYLILLTGCVGGAYILFSDHFIHTKKALQTYTVSEHKEVRSNLLNWFQKLMGLQAGKYLFYVSSHPYNRVQALFFIIFPLFYIPLMVGDIPAGGGLVSNFLFLFIMMYVPLGFLMLCVGNLFGYEHRELLLHVQFPIKTQKIIEERYWGAIFLPLAFFTMITILELILFFNTGYLFTYLIGNIFIFLSLLVIFSWSAFNQYQKIPWVSFTFTQPVISKSVAMVTGLVMVILCIIAYIPLGGYEHYKHLFLIIGILALTVMLYSSYRKQLKTFKQQILPQLWTEL